MQPHGGGIQSNEVSRSRIISLFWQALLLRVGLAMLLQLTGLEGSLKLTKDGVLYDSLGQEIAEYYRTSGRTPWPERVDGILDHLYEHTVGVIYYFTGDSMLMMRILNALAGSLVVLCVWRMARYITDARTAYRAAVWACIFPTQLYYSCLPVRDSHSTFAMAMIFLGMTAIACGGKTKYVMALPVGLLLTAGYRTYVAAVLIFLLPAAWLAALVLVRSRKKSKSIQRIALLAFMSIPVMANLGFEKVFSTGKAARITDMDYWNSTRVKMNHGSGALYQGGDIPELGKDILNTVQGVVVGVYFFFVSINPSEMDSVRQWMAIPEVLIVLYMLPKLWRGFRRVLKYHRFECFSLLFVAFAITFAYSSVTTNAGPLMRWRLQVVNVYILVAAIGWSRQYLPEQLSRAQSRRPAAPRPHPTVLRRPLPTGTTK